MKTEDGLIVKFYTPAEIADMICPVCGYYCLGKGGHGCIGKLSMYESENSRLRSEPAGKETK